MVAKFAPGIEIPLHPFFGSMGNAPPESAGRFNSAPRGLWRQSRQQGTRRGSTLYIPVHAPGALFEVGDGQPARATAKWTSPH